jgi:hypothetical protein
MELRLRVWRNAIHSHRVIQLVTTWNAEAFENWDVTHANDTLMCMLVAFFVTLRYTCQESRNAVKSFYTPFMIDNRPDEPVDGPDVSLVGKLGTQVNSENDQLVIGPWGLEHLDCIGTRLNVLGIRDLAKSLEYVGLGAQNFIDVRQVLKTSCPNLAFLKFILGAGPDWTNNELVHALEFVPIESNLEDLVDFSAQREMNALNERQRGLYNSHRWRIQGAQAVKSHFNNFVEENFPEWENIEMNVCFLSRMVTGSREWTSDVYQKIPRFLREQLYEFLKGMEGLIDMKVSRRFSAG